MKLNLGLAQINTRLGVPQANLEKHLEMIEQARQSSVDLLVFPELSLTGYVLQDLASAVAHRPIRMTRSSSPLLEASRELDLVVGFVDEDAATASTSPRPISLEARWCTSTTKSTCPPTACSTKGASSPGAISVRAFDTRFGRLGMLICEDFWHASPPYLLWLDGADLLLFTSASPGRGLTARTAAGIRRAGWSISTGPMPACSPPLWSTPTASAIEDGLNFWGGSTVFDPNGKLLAQAPYHEEALTVQRDRPEPAAPHARPPAAAAR